MELNRKKILISYTTGWAVLGILISPFLTIIYPESINMILIYTPEIGLLINFMVSTIVMGVLGYVWGLQKIKKYEQQPELLNNLPAINWLLIFTVLLITGIGGIVYSLLYPPCKGGLECLAFGLVVGIHAFIGSIISVILGTALGSIEKFKYKGVRNLGIIFILSFILIIVLYNWIN